MQTPPRNILCYGDSNTYGYSVEEPRGQRYPRSVRWPGVLQNALGNDWHVLEEGLNGRTTVHDDLIEGIWRNGRTPLLAILHSHEPLDWVVIKLGTNDLKTRFHKDPREIALSVGVLVNDVKQAKVGHDGKSPNILIIAPAPILAECEIPFPAFNGQAEISQGFAEAYAAVAQEQQVHFLDAGALISSSPVDGIHLSSHSHGVLGKAVADYVLEHTS